MKQESLSFRRERFNYNLYRQPIVDIAKVQEWTGLKTRSGAQKVVDRLMDLGILKLRDPLTKYARCYEYRTYLSLFENETV